MIYLTCLWRLGNTVWHNVANVVICNLFWPKTGLKRTRMHCSNVYFNKEQAKSLVVRLTGCRRWQHRDISKSLGTKNNNVKIRKHAMCGGEARFLKLQTEDFLSDSGDALPRAWFAGRTLRGNDTHTNTKTDRQRGDKGKHRGHKENRKHSVNTQLKPWQQMLFIR